MISDQITLGSRSSYLLNANEQPNLAALGGQPASTPRLAEHQIWNIDALELLLEADDLTALLQRPDALQTPLLEIRTWKEVFPGLYAHPTGTRVHSIAGLDDFESGRCSGCFVTSVNRIPTIVSRCTDHCSWESLVYHLPTGAALSSASWELAISRLVHQEQFRYCLCLRMWRDHRANRAPDGQFSLASDQNAEAPRSIHFELADRPEQCRAFQLLFTADVKIDSPFHELHRTQLQTPEQESGSADTIGMPLLRAIRLLEEVENRYRFYSLHELLQQASYYQMLPPQGDPLRRLLLTVDYPAVLVGKPGDQPDYEFLELSVADGVFSRVEARLQVTERLKPVTGSR